MSEGSTSELRPAPLTQLMQQIRLAQNTLVYRMLHLLETLDYSNVPSAGKRIACSNAPSTSTVL